MVDKDALDVIIEIQRHYMKHGELPANMPVIGEFHPGGCHKSAKADGMSLEAHGYGFDQIIKKRYGVSAGSVTQHVNTPDGINIHPDLIEAKFADMGRLINLAYLAGYQITAWPMDAAKMSLQWLRLMTEEQANVFYGVLRSAHSWMFMMNHAVFEQVVSRYIVDDERHKDCTSVLMDVKSGEPIYVTGLTKKDDIVKTTRKATHVPLLAGPLGEQCDAFLVEPFPFRKACADGVEYMVNYANERLDVALEGYKRPSRGMHFVLGALARESPKGYKRALALQQELPTLFAEVDEGKIRSGNKTMIITTIEPDLGEITPDNFTTNVMDVRVAAEMGGRRLKEELLKRGVTQGELTRWTQVAATRRTQAEYQPHFA